MTKDGVSTSRSGVVEKYLGRCICPLQMLREGHPELDLRVLQSHLDPPVVGQRLKLSLRQVRLLNVTRLSRSRPSRERSFSFSAAQTPVDPVTSLCHKTQ